MTSSSTTVPGPGTTTTALVPIEKSEELDEQTALLLVRAMRPVGVVIAVGGMAPLLLGLFLLENTGVPGVALAAMLAFTAAVPAVVLTTQRRHFLAECRSLGIAPKLAKKLFRRYAFGDFSFHPKVWRIGDIERLVVKRLLKP